MLSPQALFRGLVARILPTPNVDSQNNDVAARMGRYGELTMLSLLRKQHGLADEGSYFVVNNGQAGIVGPLSPAAFSAINPAVLLAIANTDSVGGGKRIALDTLHLLCTIAGAAAAGISNLRFAWTIDNTDRYTSGGTDLTPSIVNPNMDSGAKSIAKVRFGALVIAAATGAVRTIIGQRQLRQLNSATAACVAEDAFLMNFGGVEPNMGPQLDLSTAKTTAGNYVFPLPPVEIGPGQSAYLHVWSPGAALTTGITFLPELAFWER